MKVFHSLMLSAVLITGCTKSDRTASTPEIDSDGGALVCASNYPLAYFAERMAPTNFQIKLSPPADVDPAFWKPKAEDIQKMQKADLILLNGASYESWLATVSLPTSKLVTTSSGFKDQLILLKASGTHTHGPKGEHAHSGTAFTTWLDLGLAIQQAEATRDALIARWPEHETQFSAQFAKLKDELKSLDREFTQVVSAKPKLPVLFSHPVYQYSERRYGINGRSLHWEPGEMPTEAMWSALNRVLAKHPAKWMLWEGAPLPVVVERLRAMGIQCLVYSPCSAKPEQGDLLKVMRDNLENLKQVYSAE
jgi:zinc transport system substrate-binding protein